MMLEICLSRSTTVNETYFVENNERKAQRMVTDSQCSKINISHHQIGKEETSSVKPFIFKLLEAAAKEHFLSLMALYPTAALLIYMLWIFFSFANDYYISPRNNKGAAKKGDGENAARSY